MGFALGCTCAVTKLNQIHGYLVCWCYLFLHNVLKNVCKCSLICTFSSLKVDAKVQPCRKEKFMLQVWCMLVKYIQSPTLQECSCALICLLVMLVQLQVYGPLEPSSCFICHAKRKPLLAVLDS